MLKRVDADDFLPHEVCRRSGGGLIVFRWVTRSPSPVFTWTEPGDPPGGALIRANPLGKPVVAPSLDRETEVDLIRCYHESGDADALEHLADAHRPMVVAMAKRMHLGSGMSLRALVEYGVMGLRIAAAPRRPSKNKKGKMVGFDLNAGNRFSTYARHYAQKEMKAAIGGYDAPSLKAQFKEKTKVEFEAWGEVKDEEWERDESDPLLRLGGHRVLMRDLQRRRTYCKPSRRSLMLWNPPPGAVYPKPIFIVSDEALRTHEAIAKDVMEGWHGGAGSDEIDFGDAAFLVASLTRSHKIEGYKEYKLPTDVLWKRYHKGCKRLGRRIPFSTNYGLGLFDRCGHELPDYSYLSGYGWGRKLSNPPPYICRNPVASIYLLRGKEFDAYEIVSIRRFRRTCYR